MSRTTVADEMINDQIRIELNKLNDFMTFESEKPAILSRIAELRALLVDSPVTETPEPAPSSLREIGLDLAQTLLRR
jgi:hypothetical protein